MIKSMTGFGRAEVRAGDKLLSIDIKSLNGKQFDLQVKLPALLKPYEFDIRRSLATHLERGTVDCTISLKETGKSQPVSINTQLAKSYYQPLAALATELQLDTSQLLAVLLKLPEVITSGTDTLTPAEWEQCKTGIGQAVDLLNQHRLAEGKALEKDLLSRINAIVALQKEISELEPLRRDKLRQGLLKLLEEHQGKEGYDQNRLEQELIYYIEKMDISEEQVRLLNHCDYFMQQLLEPGDSKGKKLSFILQEIGREINTTGSKAYDAAIQQRVVQMKDELEKAKEQILNVM
ncbi:MAG: YicC/YloC family endoribonuclease [Sphingomonadales bacterium]